MIGLARIPLIAKIGGGVLLALLLALAVQTWRLSSARGEAEALRAGKADCEASIRLQNAQIEAGARALAAQDERLREAEGRGTARMSSARERARALRHLPPINCPTPVEVMGADL